MQCRYSHNILDIQPLMVLEKFNIDTRNGQDVILEILKYKMKHGGKPRKASMDGAVDRLANDLAQKGSISSQHLDGSHLAEQVCVLIYLLFIYQNIIF